VHCTSLGGGLLENVTSPFLIFGLAMDNVNVIYGCGFDDVICKHCISKIIKEMYCWLQMDTDKVMGAMFPQERGGSKRGSKGGITHVY
jgi:hypothetical protein